jgi:hypothetical protein
MCAKSGMNYFATKLIVTITAIIFYKFPMVVALVTGIMGFWLIVWSHRCVGDAYTADAVTSTLTPRCRRCRFDVDATLSSLSRRS